MVKKGYKQTELGVIPEKWTVSTIGAIADVKTGPFGSALHANDYVQDGTPIITVEHLGETGLTRQNLPKVSAEDRRRLSAYSMQEGDIVFSRVGAVDRNAYVTAAENGWLFSGRILRLRAKSEELSTRYLGYYFKAEETKERVRGVAVGQTMASLNTKLMNAFKVVLPTVEEQKNIAALLSNMDTLISTLEKQISKKKAIKQGAMLELLTGKRRLPGFLGEWEEKPISFFGNFISGNCFPIEYQGCPRGELPFYKVSDFNNAGNSRVMGKANNYISHNIASVLSCKIIPKNSVVFAKIGAAISLERKRITGFDCCIDNNMMSFLPYQKNIAAYMCYLFQTIRFGEFVEATALPSLSGKTIGEIQRTFPPTVEEQIAIATVLSDLDSEIEALEQKLTKYHQVKQGMMQQLLTGKIRLV